MSALALALSLLLAGLLIGLAELPYQALSELGFHLQALWPLGSGRMPDPRLVLATALGTALFVGLAWKPLAAGRGGGVTGVLLLQDAGGDGERRSALASLGLGRQLVRLPLVALTHLAGLSVGTESPSAALGASILLALRARLAPLQRLSLPLTAAIGGGAGLGAAFRAPLLGAAYALEELSAERGFSLVAPTLALGGIGTLLTSELGQPARQAVPPPVLVPPALLPLALGITVAAALAGVGLVRLLLPLARCLGPLLRRRTAPMALAIAAAFALLALASGGISLNDGSLALGPALAGAAAPSPWWAPLPRLLGPLLSLAIGAPGGLMHDSMSLGAVLVSPWLAALPEEQRAALAAIAAAATFSGACRTPLFCALFVFTLQGQPSGLPLLLTAAAIAAALGRWLGGESWNGVQLAAARAAAPGLKGAGGAVGGAVEGGPPSLG
ncbi:chloride channel protein [Cyanobium sp. NIES-981]|uniref:chloride channel protein n=1 Tax=Cyanobium sp. NIES-981 TaxID=1851505 RepID=UPI0007DDD57C|nr:chloride channel protein [Cyanobium sp. NIES-981]SBO44878.1 putative chloride channel [Cyanobium sp. NIES-981]